jgi:hypothetical protein
LPARRIPVARNREPDVLLKTIATDFGISESCLANWLKAADVEDGIKPGTTEHWNCASTTYSRSARVQ